MITVRHCFLGAQENALVLDGCRAHDAKPFKGERFSLVFFTAGDWNRMGEQSATVLNETGFILPTKELLDAAKELTPPPHGYAEVHEPPNYNDILHKR
jgi:hypothetical protein